MDGTVGARLREERERLRMNQEELASVGDIRKLTQIQYEKDKTSPTANYLSAIATVGVDVTYILTGHRMSEPQRQQLAVTAQTVREMEPHGGPLTEKLQSAYKKQGTDRESPEYVELLEVLAYCKPADLKLLKAAAVWMAKR